MIKDFFQRELLQDRAVTVLVTIGLAIGLVNLFSVILGVNSSDFDVPVRFTQYGASPLVLGEWYKQYELGLFSLVVPAANTVVAIRLHRVSRQLAVSLLLLNVLVMVLLFIVTRALLALSPV